MLLFESRGPALSHRLLLFINAIATALSLTPTTTHARQGLIPITVEGEEERERELERKLEQEQSLGGKGTADAPLNLGDDRAQSPPPAVKAVTQHRLYDVHGGGAPKRQRTKQQAKVAKTGAPVTPLGSGINIDSLVAESSEPTRPDGANGKRSSKNSQHDSFNREKSTWDATTTAAKAPPAKEANADGAGASAGAGAGGDGPKDSASPSRRYRITSASQLPPGWKVMRIEQPDKHVSTFLVCTMRQGG